MSEFKNLSDEDVLRIERGIVYSFPARRDNKVICIGKYGDLEIHCPKEDVSAAELFPSAISRISFWMCSRISGLIDGERFCWSEGWKVVDGKPVAPELAAIDMQVAS